MNRQNLKLGLFFIIGLLTAFLVMYIFQNYKIEKKNKESGNTEIAANAKSNRKNSDLKDVLLVEPIAGIKEMTEQNMVISYVKRRKNLPDYYMTKSEAKKSGWVPSKGNLCDVLPGKAIGGDQFRNRERQLPGDQQYYEADVNYNCGNRNADRIVFTKNGEVYLTKDHYKTFQEQ